ncbi:MAG: DNA polymerase III subunit epsilon [Rhodospirillaceae bacterium]|nr:DNA polymerase III subunit epsilon [Rhodospirillaceae bacterium]
MREIVLDTETTGLEARAGDRIVEIACIELVNHLPTGRTFHRYVNPERTISSAAFEVHGLNDAFLASQPRFADIVDELLAFIGDSPLVIHNAEFDLGFLCAELERCGRPALACRAVDTLELARRKFPGAPASLDALCRRFGIDNSARAKHGALLDSELLAEVYLELIGGRQAGFELAAAGPATAAAAAVERVFRPPRPHAPTVEELVAHAALVAKLKDPLWPPQPQLTLPVFGPGGAAG